MCWAVLLLCLCNSLVSAARWPGTENVDLRELHDRYLITLKADTDLAGHLAYIKKLHAEVEVQKANGTGFIGITHSWSISDFRAYAGHFDPYLVDRIRSHDQVRWVERDAVWRPAGIITQYDSRLVNLGLISHRYRFKAGEGYAYDSYAGFGTYAYVVDSGIDCSHPEFEHRAYAGYNALAPVGMSDTLGHGTHVAGVIGGKRFGVAKRTRLVAVKVVAGEEGYTTTILDGFEWAAQDIIDNNRQDKAVINLSLGGPFSRTLSAAMDDAYKLGVSAVAAVGLVAQRPRTVWPDTAILVGATDLQQHRASWCDDNRSTTLYAPGVGIKAAYIGGGNSMATSSGTSQAAAHVSGLVVYLKSIKRLPDAKQTKQALIMLATRNVIPNILRSPNLFAYNGSGK